jgi:2,3-bisphosphoglycerate-independent phosphoglycerate mutase
LASGRLGHHLDDRAAEAGREALVPFTAESVVIDMARPDGKNAMLLVLDGLGGYRTAERGSELTEARTPNFDRLAWEGSLGLHDPVTRGITPGSGAGHLGLFGYDPLQYEIGRGALSAAGIGFELRPGDVAARVNFCTLAADGTIADRRAGRLPTEEAAEICALLRRKVRLEGAEFFLEPEREHRGLFVLRGEGLGHELTDTDPQKEGVAPLDPEGRTPEAKRTAELAARFLEQARALLAGRERGNFLLLRGFDTHKELPRFPDRYRVRALAIAAYPMYLGISRLLGFETHKVDGAAPEEVDALAGLLPGHDFVFMHVKKTDSAGEDGDFERKVAAIEEVDALVPSILSAGVEVLAVTGDHSTPAQMAAHSWHPVPVLLWGGTAAADGLPGFDEVHCRQGSLGRFDARHLLPQLLAAAGRLAKYGA